MKTSYSRRELYAFGEPIGESSTYELAGHRVYGGGGGGFVGDIVGGAVDAIGDLGQGAIDTVGDVGKSIDQTVRDVVPGGWTGAALLAAGAYYAPEIGAWIDKAGAVVPGSEGVAPVVSGTGASSGAAKLAGQSALDAMGADMVTGNMAGVAATPVAADAMGANMVTGSMAGVSPTAAATAGAGLGAADAARLAKAAGSVLSPGAGTALAGAGLGALGAAALMNDRPKVAYNPQGDTGPLSQFKYNPASFSAARPDPSMFRPQGIPTAQMGYGPQMGMGRGVGGYGGGMGGYGGGMGMRPSPDMFRPRMQRGRSYMGDDGAGLGGMYAFAEGGPVGFGQGGPMEQQMQVPTPDAVPPAVNSGVMMMAHGGLSSLGGYAAGGNPRLLKGPGDGMSDSIPASIGNKQPARLADGEFVVPADVVSHLGNGSTDAGAKKLYAMMDKVRHARTGNKRQGKEIKADKYLPK